MKPKKATLTTGVETVRSAEGWHSERIWVLLPHSDCGERKVLGPVSELSVIEVLGLCDAGGYDVEVAS